MPEWFTWEQVSRQVYSTVNYWYKSGYIARDMWLRYCYESRNLSFRFSDLGKHEAREYAEVHGLPLAYSDRTPQERDNSPR